MSSLDQIKIDLQGIGFALSNNNLAVPVYQRSYAWEEKHVNSLFSDLEKAINDNEKEYFLGSIVVTPDRSGNREQLEVVDGQQRLATTSILLAAIRDHFYNAGERVRAEGIEREYLMTPDLRTLERIPRLRLNEVDHDYFYRRVLSLPDDMTAGLEAAKDSHKRLADAARNAALYISTIVSTTNKPVDRLMDWVDYIKASAKVIWVQVPDDTNAFTVFETLNDRGLDLAVSDLLKNYLFGLASERIGEVQQRWISMTGALEAVEEENETIVRTYIRHLWSSKYGLTREKELYQKIKSKITNKRSAVDFTSELSENSRRYAAILNSDHEIWNQYGTEARVYISTLNQLGMVPVRPLILAILDKFSIAEVRKSFRLMVSWTVRFTIAGGLGTGALENNCSQRAVEVRDGSIKTARDLAEAMRIVPNDSQFKSAFEIANVSKNRIARYYLRVLETQAGGDSAPEFIPNINEEAVNLEHILPQTPSPAWHHIDSETAKAYCNRIGNLAILKSKINSSVGNDGFLEKRPHYAKSPYKLTSALGKYETWSVEQIEDRQKELAELAVLAWPNKV